MPGRPLLTPPDPIRAGPIESIQRQYFCANELGTMARRRQTFLETFPPVPPTEKRCEL